MTTKSSEDENRNHTIGLATEIVSSFVSNNSLPAAALPDLIRSVATVLNEVSKVTTPKLVKRAPAVAIKHSITDEHVICLEDGKKLKMLKRYLRTKYNLTPDEYRQKWGLPANYPMVAPAYARRRSEFAKKIGLGLGVGRIKK